MTDPALTPPRHAASVVLLRPCATGFDVLLQRRHQDAKVLGGRYVFPGGKLEHSDQHPEQRGPIDTHPEQLQQRLGETDLSPEQATGLYIAALRELHEETGVLLLSDAHGQAVAAGRALQALPTADLPWPQRLAQAGLQWHTQALRPWSRWITPRNPPVPSPRFDTRFFLAILPEDQEAGHDMHEAVENLWLSPLAALQAHSSGRLSLLPPQLMTLDHLARLRHWTEAWELAGRQTPPCIEPEHVRIDGVPGMCYPGDPLHPVRTRAMPGPTRLQVQNHRFAPFDGFVDWQA